MDVVVVVLDIGSAFDALGPVLVDAVDPFLTIDTGPEAFLTVETGRAGCAIGLFSSWMCPLTPFTFPFPGIGK